MKAYKITRREVWRARNQGWRGRLRDEGILTLLGIGLAMTLVAGVWYWENSSFARRSVVTSATVEKVHGPYRLEREDGPAWLRFNGTVRYQVAGQTVRGLVHLRTCHSACRVSPGTRMTVAYDSQNVTKVRRSPEQGLSTAPNPDVLLLVGIGVLLFASGVYQLVLGDSI